MDILVFVFRNDEKSSVYIRLTYYGLLLQLIATSTADFYMPLVYVREVVSMFHPKATRIAMAAMWTLYAIMMFSLTALFIWIVETQMIQ